nr:MAG TPA: hypothetical protein [Caudoviricetes sp.]
MATVIYNIVNRPTLNIIININIHNSNYSL